MYVCVRFYPQYLVVYVFLAIIKDIDSGRGILFNLFENIHSFHHNMLILYFFLYFFVFVFTFITNRVSLLSLIIMIYLAPPHQLLSASMISVKTLNQKLLNGLFNVHPFLIYAALSLLITYFFFFKFKKLEIPSLGWTFSLLGIALGAWWAFQEVAWGGWWNWDFVEVVNLYYVLVVFCLLHRWVNFGAPFSNINGFFFFCSFGFLFFINRYALLPSIHSFVSSTTFDYIAVCFMGALICILSFWVRQYLFQILFRLFIVVDYSFFLFAVSCVFFIFVGVRVFLFKHFMFIYLTRQVIYLFGVAAVFWISSTVIIPACAPLTLLELLFISSLKRFCSSKSALAHLIFLLFLLEGISNPLNCTYSSPPYGIFKDFCVNSVLTLFEAQVSVFRPYVLNWFVPTESTLASYFLSPVFASFLKSSIFFFITIDFFVFFVLEYSYILVLVAGAFLLSLLLYFFLKKKTNFFFF